MRHRLRIAFLLALGALLPGCISGGAPPPAVRWFDPMPPAAAASATAPDAALPPLRLQPVLAAPHLDRRFLLRIGPREVMFDEVHRWTADPADVVAAALARELFAGRGRPQGGAARDAVLAVTVTAFEIDLQGAPRAVVELHARWPGGNRAFRAEAAAPDRAPERLAAAMAEALGRAIAELAAAVAAGSG